MCSRILNLLNKGTLSVLMQELFFIVAFVFEDKMCNITNKAFSTYKPQKS